MHQAAAIRARCSAALAGVSGKARSLASFRARASLHRGRVPGNGAPLTMGYFGNGANLPFLVGAAFGGASEARDLGPRNIWQASEFSREQAASADFTVYDLPWPWEMSFGADRCVVEVPSWVRQAVTLPADRESFFRRLPRSVRGEQMRKIRRNGLTCRITRDTAEIERFYRSMYAPHVRRRFGTDATIVPESRLLKYGRQGALLQILRDERVIAGSVLYRVGDVVQSLWSGFDGDDLRTLDGATAALFFHLVEFAFEHGCRRVDYCGSRPLLSDGVFETKRRWGAAVDDDWSLESLLFEFNRLDAGVTGVLQRCPWITRQDGELVGKVLVGGAPLSAESLERRWSRLACEGLAALHVYALDGIEEDAARVVDRSVVPVRLFDLRREDDPLSTYCDR